VYLSVWANKTSLSLPLFIEVYVNATDFGNDFNKQRTQRKTEGKTNTRWSPGEDHWHAFNTVVDHYLPEKQANLFGVLICLGQ
jgi:hypothetical protein